MAKLPTTARRTVALALALLLLCQSPALAGIVVYRGTQGLTMSGADGVYYDNTAGLTMSGADGLLGLSVNGIGVRATGDGLTMSGADGLTMSGADSVTYTGSNTYTATHVNGLTMSGADGLTMSGADGLTMSGADGTTHEVNSIVVQRADGLTMSGADNVTMTGVNGLTMSGADGVDDERGRRADDVGRGQRAGQRRGAGARHRHGRARLLRGDERLHRRGRGRADADGRERRLDVRRAGLDDVGRRRAARADRAGHADRRTDAAGVGQHRPRTRAPRR